MADKSAKAKPKGGVVERNQKNPKAGKSPKQSGPKGLSGPPPKAGPKLSPRGGAKAKGKAGSKAGSKASVSPRGVSPQGAKASRNLSSPVPAKASQNPSGPVLKVNKNAKQMAFAGNAARPKAAFPASDVSYVPKRPALADLAASSRPAGRVVLRSDDGGMALRSVPLPLKEDSTEVDIRDSIVLEPRGLDYRQRRADAVAMEKQRAALAYSSRRDVIVGAALEKAEATGVAPEFLSYSDYRKSVSYAARRLKVPASEFGDTSAPELP